MADRRGTATKFGSDGYERYTMGEIEREREGV